MTFLVASACGLVLASPAARVASARRLDWTWVLAALPVVLATAPVPATRPLAWGLGVAAIRGALLLRRAGGDRSLADAFRAGRRDDGAAYTLGANGRGRPVRVRLGAAGGRHALLVAASGAGKSHALTWIATRHIAAGFGCVVIDMKADVDLARTLETEAVLRGRAFHRWTLDGGDRWNPLARGNASELKDKLIATERFTEPHYKRMYERYLLNLLRALEADGRAIDLGRVVPLLDPDRLLGALRDVPDAAVAGDVGRYLDGLGADQRRHLGGLADRLSVLVEAGHGRYLVESDDPSETIDLERAITRGGVVVFSLNASRYPETAALVGNLVVQDLKAVCGALEADPSRKRPALVAIDEFSALASEHVAGLFQRARSALCSMLVSTQEVADLRRAGTAFDEQVLGNVEIVLAGRQNNPASAELIAALAGGEEAWETTFHSDERGRRTRASRRRTLEPLVAPDRIKRLDVGELVLIEKNPHRVELVSVVPPGASEDQSGAWLAARAARLRAADL